MDRVNKYSLLTVGLSRSANHSAVSHSWKAPGWGGIRARVHRDTVVLPREEVWGCDKV